MTAPAQPTGVPASAVNIPPEAWLRVCSVLDKLAASSNLGEVLGLVIDSMRDCLRADRASVFQYDARAQELFVSHAHGGVSFRFPITKGIAGEAARTKSIINVHDAWEDPRFNREFDQKSGYRTRGLLTIPLVSFDGTLEGVAQVLNKNPALGPYFDDADELLARALASQAAIAMRRARQIDAEIRKNKIEADLQVARNIQMAALPKELPSVPGYSIAGQTAPAEETGGDTFDLVDLSTITTRGGDPAADAVPVGRGMVILVGDATGHGVGPAISVTQARAMVRMGMRLRAPLPLIAEHLNAQLCEDLPPGRFITAFLGVLDPVRHAIDYVAPGQAPLLVVRADGGVEERSANAMPLGIDPDQQPEAVEPFLLGPGDTFLLLSDGYFEAMAPDDEQFGQDRVVQVVRSMQALPAIEVLNALNTAAAGFVRGRPFGDDQTAVIIKREA